MYNDIRLIPYSHMARTVISLTMYCGGSVHDGNSGFATYVPKDRVIILNINGRIINKPT